MRPSRSGVQVLLMSDDLVFSQAFADDAGRYGIEVNTYGTLAELGSIAYLGHYDLLIADTLMGPVNGLEIAEYAAAFFPGLPVLLTAPPATPHGEQPVSVVGTFDKTASLPAMIEQILSIDYTAHSKRQMPDKRPLLGTI